jgi:hypothetical protein
MKRSKGRVSRRGRPPSLEVAARKTNKLRKDVQDVLADLEELEKRLLRLDSLLAASRLAEKERAKERAANHKGLRGKGPNVRDVAYQILTRRRRPMEIQEISNQVLKVKKGAPGGNFTQNLGAALARDPRFARVGRGMYTVKR